MSTGKLTDSEKILDRVAIGRRLREERVRLDLNQIDLAKALGLESAAAVSRYEKGQVPKPDILARYAKVTGRSEQYLLCREDGDGGQRKPKGPPGNEASKVDKLDTGKRRLLQLFEDLYDSGDPEIVGHLRRQLKLLKDLKDRRTKS